MRTIKGGIAFFDSGIGGLTVLAECRKQLPNTLFYYYGDNKHAPYGNLPPQKIKKYVFRVFKRFQRLRVWAAVVACNTATAVCIEELRDKFSFPIIGVEPAILPAVRKGGEVFVLTTRATYESSRFRNLCKNAQTLFPDARVRLFPCDGLAGTMESHIFEKDYDYTPLLPKGSPDGVVLGCTHYVYIAEQIKAFYGCPIFDGNQGISRRLSYLLSENFTPNEHRQPPDDHFQPFSPQKPLKKECDTAKIGVGAQSKKAKRLMFGAKVLRRKKAKKGVKKGKIVFLGGYRKHNKHVYEQMFV